MYEVDPDFGLIVRAKLIELGLEDISNQAQSYNYTHSERKAAIEHSLKTIYDMCGVADTPFIKNLAESIYGNYQGMSYRFFPKLKKPYIIEGSINSICESVKCFAQIVDERDWTKTRQIMLTPFHVKSRHASIDIDNIQLLLNFFTSRPVTDLEVLEKQIETALSLLYAPENEAEFEFLIEYR